jgi:hypothetical protein
MFKNQSIIKLTFMKRAIQIFSIVLLFLFAGCDKDTVELDQDTIPGKWKLRESYISDGSPGKWEQSKKDLVVEFKTDGSLAGNVFSNYVSYVIKDTKTIVFMKADKTEQNYAYELKDGVLTMSPSGPIMCVEGCADRFIKIN